MNLLVLSLLCIELNIVNTITSLTNLYTFLCIEVVSGNFKRSSWRFVIYS